MEAHDSTKNKFTDQETQVGMAGQYTAETVRTQPDKPYSGTPKASEVEGDQGIHGEKECLKRPKESKRPGWKSKVMPRKE